jgi:hypothetical protein
MSQLPQDLNEAIAQARTATQAALGSGLARLQVELVFPELKQMEIAAAFLPTFEPLNLKLKVLFPDAGAAALARREWASETPFAVEDLGTSRSPVERNLQPEDEIFLLVEPSAVEVAQVEKLCQLVQPRPVVLLNPRLEDAATVGIGYAGRQLRERFLSTLESCYYIRPLDTGVLYRCYPGSWEIWQETADGYDFLTERSQKPSRDELDEVLAPILTGGNATTTATPRKGGLLAGLDRFFRALSQ